MKDYWFGKRCSNWQVWVLMFAACAAGQGLWGAWIACIVIGAAVEALMGVD